MEPIERAAARERQGTRNDLESTSGKLSQKSEPVRVRDKIGAFAGVSGRTVEKIAAVTVVDLAEGRPGEPRSGKLPEHNGARTRDKIGA